ncbi:hypothetical protein Ngar_c04800 [Candidatus Nitrososphaera gargensis Ga9.2]|uniref:Uncharacterized protein n=1 Tax=Nitrososphaera gargensis (strain Ga9.2) TaxID=1237085 RepID=K0ILX7_NITGG|nr:hypothetical protein [Candidatus Nitrososphaera gargensis]AFU57424.1 hypothetical protein Ngar_c04800 [Candidatus Nitrososphaera gargensis Ga9.2]
MKTKLAIAAIAALLALFGGIFALATPALANLYSDTMTSSSDMATDDGDNDDSNTMTSRLMDHSIMSWFDKGKKFGIVSSIQNEDGEPAWVVVGHWMMTNETGNIDFYAGFYMTRLDGSAQHTHEIYNFRQAGESSTEGNVTMVRGTSTVTLREGPAEDVETTITLSQGNVIAISLDREAVEDHFGDTPIYGMTITPEIIHHIMNATTASKMMGNYGGGMHSGSNNDDTTMTGEMWK